MHHLYVMFVLSTSTFQSDQVRIFYLLVKSSSMEINRFLETGQSKVPFLLLIINHNKFEVSNDLYCISIESLLQYLLLSP